MSRVHCPLVQVLERLKGLAATDTSLPLAERARRVRLIDQRIEAAERMQEIAAMAGEARDGTLIVAAIVLAPVAVATLTLAVCWWLA